MPLTAMAGLRAFLLSRNSVCGCISDLRTDLATNSSQKWNPAVNWGRPALNSYVHRHHSPHERDTNKVKYIPWKDRLKLAKVTNWSFSFLLICAYLHFVIVCNNDISIVKLKISQTVLGNKAVIFGGAVNIITNIQEWLFLYLFMNCDTVTLVLRQLDISGLIISSRALVNASASRSTPLMQFSLTHS